MEAKRPRLTALRVASTRDVNRRELRSESGFTLLEISIAISLLAIGLMGFIAAMISAQMLTRVTREMNLANAEIIIVVETFREACASDFESALVTFDGQVTTNPVSLRGIGSDVTVTSVVVSDETLLSPPIDLNDDGDFLDTSLTPADVSAAALRVKISWTGVAGSRVVEYTTIVARGGG